MFSSFEDQSSLVNKGKSILLLSPFGKQQRGNTLTAARLCRGLQKMGWQIDNISLDESGTVKEIKENLAEGKYCLWHGLHAGYMGSFRANMPEISSLPFLLTMTGTDLGRIMHTRQNNDLIYSTLQAAHAIVVFNSAYVNLIAEVDQNLTAKTHIIPQGVELENGKSILVDEAFSPSDFVILLPSGLRTIKNIDMAINAVDVLQEKYKELRLLIIGAPIQEDYAERIIEKLKTRNYIKYIGEVDHHYMKSIFQMGKVVLNCSHTEGQPQAALEAMSLGIPCILTAVPGNLNIITHGRQGLYINDTEQLCEAIEYYIANENRRLEMGDAAAHLVAEHFLLDAEIKAYDSLYKNLLSKKQ